MILSVHVRLRDGEYIVQEQISKVADVVTFPVFHPAFEVLDGSSVLRPSLLLIHLVCDSLRRFETGLEFIKMGIFRLPYLLDERLEEW